MAFPASRDCTESRFAVAFARCIVAIGCCPVAALGRIAGARRGRAANDNQCCQAAFRHSAGGDERRKTLGESLLAALHYVTTLSSFHALIAMHSEAVDLQLKSCAPTGHGDYNCVFRHRYPKRMHDSGYGESDFIAAPAINPGWYMYLFEDCG